jgi:hypothetical protein
MVAADVHGKNTIRPVVSAVMFAVYECGFPMAESWNVPTKSNRNSFYATIGGMGLTGFILEVEFILQKIPSPWIWQEPPESKESIHSSSLSKSGEGMAVHRRLDRLPLEGKTDGTGNFDVWKMGES